MTRRTTRVGVKAFVSALFVKNLTVSSSSDQYQDYNCYIYVNSMGKAIQSQALTPSASLEVIQSATENAQQEGESVVIPGLLLLEDFLTEDEEKSLMDHIDRIPWVLSQSGRRKQDYGPQVNFKHKKVKTNNFTGMPNYATLLLEKMKTASNFLDDYRPLEMCNLEYDENRRSAIEFHRDDTWIWGRRLISINLLNGSIMSLVNETTKQLVFVLMPRRSLLCMADGVRYDWKHIRGRRVALTMREAASAFQEGGELYEKFGRQLLELGDIRLPLPT